MIRRAIDSIRNNPILALIVLNFLILSSTGIFYNFGLATTVGDEAPSMSAALKMIADHTLRPAYPTLYYPPVNVFAALPFVLLGVLSLPMLGVPLDPALIKEFVILDYAKLLPWVRLASVFYGTLSVYLLYRIALRVFGRGEIALLAAFLFSTSLLFIQLVHFGRVWSVQILAILLGVWMSLRVFDAPTLKRYLVTGMAILLAFGVNVIGGIVYVSFVAAHFFANKGKSFREILFHRWFLSAHAVIAGGIGVLYYLNPYGLENYVRIIRRFFSAVDTAPGIERALSGGLARYCGEDIISGLTYYPRILAEYDLAILALFLLGGSIAIFRKKAIHPEVIILGLFGLVYLVSITAISAFGVNTCEPRYALPLVPLLALVAAGTTFSVIARFGTGSARPILFVVVILSLYGSLLFDLRLALPSTRLEARAWILENIPNHSRIITLEEPIALPENVETIRDIEKHSPYFLTKKRAYLRDANVLKDPSVSQYYVLTPAYFRENIPQELLADGYEYFVISWWNAEERTLRLRQGLDLGTFDEVELLKRFPENATERTESLDLPNNLRAPLFKLHRLTQNGPTIEVYRIIR